MKFIFFTLIITLIYFFSFKAYAIEEDEENLHMPLIGATCMAFSPINTLLCTQDPEGNTYSLQIQNSHCTLWFNNSILTDEQLTEAHLIHYFYAMMFLPAIMPYPYMFWESPTVGDLVEIAKNELSSSDQPRFEEALRTLRTNPGLNRCVNGIINSIERGTRSLRQKHDAAIEAYNSAYYHFAQTPITSLGELQERIYALVKIIQESNHHAEMFFHDQYLPYQLDLFQMQSNGSFQNQLIEEFGFSPNQLTSIVDGASLRARERTIRHLALQAVSIPPQDLP